MKKILSILFCLVICISIFTTAINVVYAAKPTDVMSVTNTGFANDQITYTISLKPNQKKISGVILRVEYDSNLLKVKNCTTLSNGYVETGFLPKNNNVYVIAFMDTAGVNTGTSSKEFAKITFNVASTKRDKTNVKFYCYEYRTDDGNNNNDIKNSNTPQLLYNSSFTTVVELAKPRLASLALSANSVVVRWNKVPSATKYLVYRKVNSAKTWTYLTTTTSLTYIDSKVSSGNNYTYTIKAYDGKKYSSYETKGWTIKYLSVPKLTKIENTYSGPRIYWQKVAGATSYEVYRRLGSKGSWTKIATTTNLLYIDKTAANNTTYSYTVKAVYSNTRSPFNTKGLIISCITAPKISKLTKSSSGITIQWNKITGAKGYYVYRKAGNATTWTRIATTSSTKYIDKNVKKGVTYTYTLKAYNSSTYSGYNGNGWKIVK